MVRGTRCRTVRLGGQRGIVGWGTGAGAYLAVNEIHALVGSCFADFWVAVSWKWVNGKVRSAAVAVE